MPFDGHALGHTRSCTADKQRHSGGRARRV